ncbi:hypothetical protein JB92DRAFT_3102070 [Gautieria morchelliformis]|nr:hypothetical protein JB92DRAFT_3102070 [Gautieria morchelliformis]
MHLFTDSWKDGAAEDSFDLSRLASNTCLLYSGKRVPQCRHMMLDSGVGCDERERSPGADEDGRGSVEGRAVQFAHRVNCLALKMTGMAAFQATTKDVFEAPCIRMIT